MTLLVMFVTGAWATDAEWSMANWPANTTADPSYPSFNGLSFISGTSGTPKTPTYAAPSTSSESSDIEFSDGSKYKKYYGSGGSSNFRANSDGSWNSLAKVFSFEAEKGDKIKVYFRGNGDSERYMYISYEASTTERDAKTAFASASSTSRAATILEGQATKDGRVYIWMNQNMRVYAITVESGTPATSYNITWENGGHGTAPTTPTTASTFALPTMDADGDYVNTGWTANQIVKVGGEDQAIGTVLATGASVTLTAATTFTGVWKTASSFALTSASEVEVAIDGTSMITTSGNAGDVDYESGDLSVATVDGSGEIKAVGSGKTTITVTDPGNASTMGKSYTVTVLVPYPNPTAADAYTLDNSQYAFSNSDNTKYYFKNGFAITNTAKKAYGSANMGTAGTGMKFSANTQYTINVPSNVTVTYAVFTARNNYGSDKTAANWGNVFGTSYSSDALPYSNETPADKDFVLDPAQTGGTLAFTPGGNQWQAIITLNTIAYHEKYAVSYAAGEGTGTMAGTEVRGGSKFNLPASTFTPPAEKGFAGWLCNIDNVVYAAGAEYTMTDANTAFTAQYEGIEGKTIIKVTLGGGTSATVSGAIGGTADVKVQSDKKFGSGHYAGFTLAGAKTFKTGDIINVRITTASSGENTKIVIYDSDKSTVLYNTGTAGVVGDNKFALPSAVNNKATLYICRTGNSETDNGWNAYVDYIEVIRPNAVATLNASGYATYSAAADFTVTGAKAYKAALNTADKKITCTEVEAVPAGAGVLLFGEANAKVAIVNTTSAAALADNDLKGTTKADGSLVALDNTKFYYALSGDTFMKYSGTAFVANKAYFESATELSAKAFAIVFDGESTGINAIEEVAPVTKTRKVVKNGRLVIETANGEFTVSGARIK